MNVEQLNKKQFEETSNKRPKRPLVFDVDDVVLNSCEAIIEIVNERYNLSPKVTTENVKDWNFTCLKREIKRQRGIEVHTQDFLKIFESEEFWNKVEFKQGIIDIVYNPQIKERFKITLVSTGTKKNLDLKIKYLHNHLNMENISFLGVPLDLNSPNYSKKEIDTHLSLWGGIQVDDKYECLNTNAKLKILLKNNKDTTYNFVPESREDLYVVNNLEELKEILMFIIIDEDSFFEDFKSIPFVWRGE